MRKQFVKTVEDLMARDERVVLLLGDIGVFGFRNAFKSYPERTYNIGICEQAMTSLAAGLAKEKLLPVVHSITPFVVERCYEQIKVDLCYQKLPCNIVSVGASYDYAGLGCTHHCPGDVAALLALPGMEIMVPGTPAEFDQLFRATYADGQPSYFRLSERSNESSFPAEFGRAQTIRRGGSATVVAVGPTLTRVLDATHDLDVTVLYYTTVAPFDAQTLRDNCDTGRIVLVEPYYAAGLVAEIHSALGRKPIRIECIGVPHRFLTDYGDAEQHDAAIGLTAEGIRSRVLEAIRE